MLNKTLLPQSVAREIQAMIQTGTLKPGEKIPSQREFSQKLRHQPRLPARGAC
jgi:GntR family transcriptional repressor for pyruvate dehydrogenase complex